jgi:hypothetical protein
MEEAEEKLEHYLDVVKRMSFCDETSIAGI